ncbi:MAG: RNA 2',3'-cyclic phosphodiesterase [Phycisphaerales bacterium]|nr:RNA 2',3'-cyclic phosphodiesterase [Phycisphaerales bacterium]
MTSLRLFVAIYPPPDLAKQLIDALPALDLPDHRPSPVEQVHLTLHFIGDIDARQLEDVRESVRRAAAGLPKFELVPQRLMTLPQHGPVRLVACETDLPPVLAELHQRLVRRLARNPRDHQRFAPHMTLCRFKTPTVRPGVDHALDSENFPPFGIESLRLMRSKLLTSGAQHEVVMTADLVETA